MFLLSAVTQTVLEVFKKLVHADIWSMYQGPGTGDRNLALENQDLRTKTELQDQESRVRERYRKGWLFIH